MSDKCCNWSITINNPTDEDHIQWEALKGLHWVKEVVGQLEKGAEGTPHIQGMIKTQSVRFTQVKKALPRAHIEPAKNPAALKQYVQKEETRVAQMPTAKVATASDLQQEIYSELLYCGTTWYKTWTPDLDSFEENLRKHHLQITEMWEAHLDAAVKSLIKQGYYGIEFVVSNNQIRNAFKKYLPEIIYRTHHARRNENPSQATA